VASTVSSCVFICKNNSVFLFLPCSRPSERGAGWYGVPNVQCKHMLAALVGKLAPRALGQRASACSLHIRLVRERGAGKSVQQKLHMLYEVLSLPKLRKVGPDRCWSRPRTWSHGVPDHVDVRSPQALHA
jgi:hypothetical protein